jgi:hypothetical protein
MNYIVQGRTADGNTVYYTGRAGQAFISTDKRDAFTYPSLNAARARATMLNQGTATHGIRFMVPVGE